PRRRLPPPRGLPLRGVRRTGLRDGAGITRVPLGRPRLRGARPPGCRWLRAFRAAARRLAGLAPRRLRRPRRRTRPRNITRLTRPPVGRLGARVTRTTTGRRLAGIAARRPRRP